MKVWALAVLICARAAAAVVETAPEAASGASGSAALGAAAVPSVPAASILAPSLAPSAAFLPASLGAAFGVAPGAGQMRLAPSAVAATPASAAPFAAAPATAPSATTQNSGNAAATADAVPAVPPPASATAAPGTAAAAAATGNDVSQAAANTGNGRMVLPAPRMPDARASAEDAASMGRVYWDQAAARPRLDATAVGESGVRGVAALAPQTAAVPGPGAATSSAAPDDGDLRDAVAAAFSGPAPASAFAVPAPGRMQRLGVGATFSSAAAAPPVVGATSPSSAPRRLERLTLSLGADLAVRVRSAADRFVLGVRLWTVPGAGAPASASSYARPGLAPLTSTRWLERRGLLETAAIPDASAPRGPAETTPASERGRLPSLAAPSAEGSRLVSARAVSSRAGSDAPLALWALAFLPATLALLRDALR